MGSVRVHARLRAPFDSMRKAAKDWYMNAPSPEEMNARFETFTSWIEVRMHALETTVKTGFEGTDLQFALIKDQFKHADDQFKQIDQRLYRIETSLDRLHLLMAKLPYLVVGAILIIVAVMTFVLNYASPLARFRTQAPTQSAPVASLLADTEAAKDDAKQVIRREGAGDRR